MVKRPQYFYSHIKQITQGKQWKLTKVLAQQDKRMDSNEKPYEIRTSISILMLCIQWLYVLRSQ